MLGFFRRLSSTPGVLGCSHRLNPLVLPRSEVKNVRWVLFKGPVFCAIHSKQGSMCTFPVNEPFSKAVTFRSGFWGFQDSGKGQVKVLSPRRRPRMLRSIMCRSFSSSSNGNGSMTKNFSENDEDYVNSSVVKAVKVKSCAGWVFMEMEDGRLLIYFHDNGQIGHMDASHPSIMLEMEDASHPSIMLEIEVEIDLLVPIIGSNLPSVLLMDAVRDVPISQPAVYQIVNKMVEKMGYSLQLIRFTKRVHDAYFAQLYLAKVGDETERVCIDLQPSDAIDIAVRCKVPIQVNKHVAFKDGMRFAVYRPNFDLL